MIRYNLLLLFFLSLSTGTFAQNKFWVFLKDKNGSTDDTREYLSKKAIERRKKINYPIGHYSDLPIQEKYINAIIEIGVKISGKSRWLNAICCYGDYEQIEYIKTLPFVSYISINNFQTQISAINHQTDDNLIEQQLSSMEGDYFTNNKFTGKSIRIAVIDAGFIGANESPVLQHLYDNKQVLKTWDFHTNKENVYKSSNHGTAVLSCIAGNNKGQLLGLAQNAEFLLARTERNLVENQSEEENWLMAIEWADANGVDIINTSLGYTADEYFPSEMDGKTSIISRAANLAASKGILIICAAGNSGDGDWKFIGTPADADSVFSVGGIDPETNLHTEFSSYGPTADLRLKPNAVAFGHVHAYSANSGVHHTQGTSFSSPLIAGFAACLWEKYPNESNMEIFNKLEKCSSLYPYYDYAHGYGIPKASYFFERIEKDTSFHIIDENNIIKIKVLNFNKEGCSEPMYMHVSDDRGTLEHYEVIKIYQQIPYVFQKENYTNKTLRFFYKGFINEIKI